MCHWRPLATGWTPSCLAAEVSVGQCVTASSRHTDSGRGRGWRAPGEDAREVQTVALLVAVVVVGHRNVAESIVQPFNDLGIEWVRLRYRSGAGADQPLLQFATLHLSRTR
jgi:hypothetical protein